MRNLSSIYDAIMNDGKQDKMLMATALFRERLSKIQPVIECKDDIEEKIYKSFECRPDTCNCNKLGGDCIRDRSLMSTALLNKRISKYFNQEGERLSTKFAKLNLKRKRNLEDKDKDSDDNDGLNYQKQKLIHDQSLSPE
jgi:hypothetical protein